MIVKLFKQVNLYSADTATKGVLVDADNNRLIIPTSEVIGGRLVSYGKGTVQVSPSPAVVGVQSWSAADISIRRTNVMDWEPFPLESAVTLTTYGVSASFPTDSYAYVVVYLAAPEAAVLTVDIAVCLHESF